MFRKVVPKLAVEKERSLIAFIPLLSVPLGISIAVVGVKKYHETKASILRKLLKDAEADLGKLRKGKEKGLRKGEELVSDLTLSSKHRGILGEESIISEERIGKVRTVTEGEEKGKGKGTMDD